jgi:hypothetical protein
MINKKLKNEEEELEAKEISDAVKEYLANGGKITQCAPNARTEDLQVGQWGRRKAKPKAKKK